MSAVPKRCRPILGTALCRKSHLGVIGRLSGAVAEGASPEEVAEGMLQKSKEFAASGNRVYLPIAD